MNIIVNDGQYCWTADADDLLSAMRAQGWAIYGNGMVEEPAQDTLDEWSDGAAAYSELCQSVSEIDDDEATATLTYWPEDGRGCWRFSGLDYDTLLGTD